MPQYTKKELEKAVAKSKTISETLRNLEMCTTGGNFRYIKKYIERWNIDASHFFTKEEVNQIRAKKLREMNGKNKIDLSEILTENSQYRSNSNLKSRLFRENKKERICEMCGQDENWKGRKFSLILDHINGISNDNRIENLRILCPNCNATLDTHCGKNKKRKKEPKIDKRLGPRPEQRKVKDRPSLETLLQCTKEFGFLATGRKYGVSDNAIRKWIKDYEKEKGT